MWVHHRCSLVAFWMSTEEELARSLTKRIDLNLYRPLEERVVDAVDINTAFIRQIVKHIMGLLCFRTSLFVFEDEINPVVQAGRDMLRF